MYLLDTNHVKELAYPTPRGQRLRDRLLASGAQVITSVITLEEELRGLLARTNRSIRADELILSYQKLIERVNFFSRWVVFSMDDDSAKIFSQLRQQGVRIGTMDLRIASIAIAHHATLLTRNTVDFAQVAGLRFENWLD